jgi:rhodanese-related sulfurtransferase
MFNRTPQVDVGEAQQLLDGGATLVDVRRADEWEAGHSPDAVHIPLDQLPDRHDELAGAQQVVMICRSGSRSARATQWLRHQGHDAVNLVGGMQAWARAGSAVVRADGSVGRVA